MIAVLLRQRDGDRSKLQSCQLTGTTSLNLLECLPTFLKSESISLYAAQRSASALYQKVYGTRTGVVGNEESDIGVVQDSGDADQAGAAARHDGDVLPRVLARLALAMHLVVEAGDSLPQRLDARGRAVLATGGGDVNGARPRETPLDVILDLSSHTVCQDLYVLGLCWLVSILDG